MLILKNVLNELPYTDIKRIGMEGSSRGGLMTYLALTHVRWIKAAVIISGPTDEVTAPKFREGWREHQISLYGKSKAEQIKRSPLYWPEKITKNTPILIMHGTADWHVQAHDAIRMAEKLYEQKVPFRLTIYEGTDHGMTEVKGEVFRQTVDWFDRFLKKGEKSRI